MKAFVDLQLVHSMVMNHNAPKTARHSIADALMELPRIELDTDADLVSRKAEPEPPTLLEVASEIAVQIRNQGHRVSVGEICRQLEAAIEREKAKQGEK